MTSTMTKEIHICQACDHCITTTEVNVDEPFCGHKDTYGFLVEPYEPPPEFCPYRNGPVTIRLAEGV